MEGWEEGRREESHHRFNEHECCGEKVSFVKIVSEAGLTGREMEGHMGAGGAPRIHLFSPKGWYSPVDTPDTNDDYRDDDNDDCWLVRGKEDKRTELAREKGLSHTEDDHEVEGCLPRDRLRGLRFYRWTSGCHLRRCGCG